jgi:hypothetical protein
MENVLSTEWLLELAEACRECSVDEIEDTSLDDDLPCMEKSAPTFD